ncbi:MAG: DNA-binding protein, partial [Aquimarina sp.]|nr:DNA-binding protein [Aquimarina sp.]
INFVNDSKIPKIKVGVTCETCSLIDCEVRKAPPKRILAKEKYKKTAELVNNLIKQYS